MLSILIPTYNTRCVNLVQQLHHQALSLGIPFEILVADDASCREIQKDNSRISDWEGCSYLQLEENIGPARIRNFLASKAKHNYLLFLDADTMPATDRFLADYLKEARPGRVVCGGFIYHRQTNPEKCALRYYYGIRVEEKNAEERNRHPYRQFIGMSFLFDQSVFARVRFDESMHFGYEDAHLGMLLEKAHIPIEHIDNPVYHLSMDSSEEYLAKIRRSVDNLAKHRDKMKDTVRLLRWYNQLNHLGLVSITGMLFNKLEMKITANLTSCHPNLSLFAVYKLGYLCRLMSQRSKD